MRLAFSAIGILATLAAGLAAAAVSSPAVFGGTRPLRNVDWSIASGEVARDGSVRTGSGNFHAAWDARHDWYLIEIDGVSYDFLNHRTLLRTGAPAGHGWCLPDSLAGDLVVRCFDLAGAPVQADFGFTAF
jgi:hypothetical protein